MFSNIFAVVQMILRLFKLWDQFLDWSDAQRAAEIEKRQQDRAKAIEDSKKAESDEEIWDSQDRIVDSRPRP